MYSADSTHGVGVWCRRRRRSAAATTTTSTTITIMERCVVLVALFCGMLYIALMKRGWVQKFPNRPPTQLHRPLTLSQPLVSSSTPLRSSSPPSRHSRSGSSRAPRPVHTQCFYQRRHIGHDRHDKDIRICTDTLPSCTPASAQLCIAYLWATGYCTYSTACLLPLGRYKVE